MPVAKLEERDESGIESASASILRCQPSQRRLDAHCDGDLKIDDGLGKESGKMEREEEREKGRSVSF